MRLQPNSRIASKHVPGGDSVLIQIFARMFGTETHVSIGGEMNHQLRALHRLHQSSPVEQVCLMKSELRMRQSGFQKSLLSGRHVIEPNDAVAGGEQSVNHVTADKTRSAGNENAQNSLR